MDIYTPSSKSRDGFILTGTDSELLLMASAIVKAVVDKRESIKRGWIVEAYSDGIIHILENCKGIPSKIAINISTPRFVGD